MNLRHAHTIDYMPLSTAAPPIVSVADAERVLGDWFGAEVVLTSAGRSAMLLYFTSIGLNRYRDRIALPRLISACVLDAVIRRAFPVDAADRTGADFTILYHQYGFFQADRPGGRVMEDICHAFYATAETGERDWVGEVAVFSLPKFFATSTMCGGLVMSDQDRANEFRELRDRTGVVSGTGAYSLADVFGKSFGAGASGLELTYLARLLNPRLGDHETGGIPDSTAEIRRIGGERRSRLDRLIDVVDRSALPEGWLSMLRATLPFAFPVFGSEEQLVKTKQTLRDAGVAADIYSLDVARNMSMPRYERAVLAPCHHLIPIETFDAITDVLGSVTYA